MTVPLDGTISVVAVLAYHAAARHGGADEAEIARSEARWRRVSRAMSATSVREGVTAIRLARPSAVCSG